MILELQERHTHGLTRRRRGDDVVVEWVLVRARHELIRVVALELHAEHARKRVRLAAERDGRHARVRYKIRTRVPFF